jgi:hypothetical protein
MISKTLKISAAIRQNISSARALWPDECSNSTLSMLRELTTRFAFSIRSGEIRLLNGVWYVTNSGLIRLAERRRCTGINSQPMPEFTNPMACRWVFKATVYKSCRSKGFVGYGDADPSNTSPLVRGAEMRVAETRAVNRALRKAYGIGLCSVEELGSFSAPQKSSSESRHSNHSGSNGSSNGQPRLRDQLSLLIRQHNLNPSLVKSYAADFCGTATLSGASRELVESFISHLSTAAKENRDSLICKLNSYAQQQEAKQ